MVSYENTFWYELNIYIYSICHWMTFIAQQNVIDFPYWTSKIGMRYWNVSIQLFKCLLIILISWNIYSFILWGCILTTANHINDLIEFISSELLVYVAESFRPFQQFDFLGLSAVMLLGRFNLYVLVLWKLGYQVVLNMSHKIITRLCIVAVTLSVHNRFV